MNWWPQNRIRRTTARTLSMNISREIEKSKTNKKRRTTPTTNKEKNLSSHIEGSKNCLKSPRSLRKRRSLPGYWEIFEYRRGIQVNTRRLLQKRIPNTHMLCRDRTISNCQYNVREWSVQLKRKRTSKKVAIKNGEDVGK